MLDDCDAALLVVHPSFADVAARRSGARLDVGADYEARAGRRRGAVRARAPSTRTTVCELFYTSGSTGEPKGAMLTHRALATHAVDSALTMGLDHRDVVLHTIPLFHVNGWGTPHYVTALGGRHVMLERFDAGEVLRLIEAERVTRLSPRADDGAPRCSTHPDVRARATCRRSCRSRVGGAPPGPGCWPSSRTRSAARSSPATASPRPRRS